MDLAKDPCSMGIISKIHCGVKFKKCLFRKKKKSRSIGAGFFFVSGRDRLHSIGLLRSAADPIVVRQSRDRSLQNSVFTVGGHFTIGIGASGDVGRFNRHAWGDSV